MVVRSTCHAPLIIMMMAMATMERVINTQEGITQANIATQFGSRGTSKVEAFHILCAESKLSLR